MNREISGNASRFRKNLFMVAVRIGSSAFTSE